MKIIPGHVLILQNSVVCDIGFCIWLSKVRRIAVNPRFQFLHKSFCIHGGTASFQEEPPRNQIENVYELSRFQMVSDLHSGHTFQNLGKKNCVCGYVCVCVSEFVEIKTLFKFYIFIDLELLSSAMDLFMTLNS